MVEKESSTFRTELGKELLWNGTSALRSAIFEALDSDGIDTATVPGLVSSQDLEEFIDRPRVARPRSEVFR